MWYFRLTLEAHGDMFESAGFILGVEPLDGVLDASTDLRALI